MYELPPSEFLFSFYTQLKLKLKRILELLEKDKKTSVELKELYEIKSNMLTAIDMLVLETSDDELKSAYIDLMRFIGSNNPDYIKIAIKYCDDVKK